MCDQQMPRPDCAYAQSDQSLCNWLEYYMTVKLLTEQHLEFLSLKVACTGSPESTIVKIPYCKKSHVLDFILVTSLCMRAAKSLVRLLVSTGLLEHS